MRNAYRGEVAISLDGEVHQMRLSLAALLELEQALDAPDLVALVERFENGRFRAEDILAVILAGLHGGGWSGDRDTLLAARLEGGVVELARLAGELLALSFQIPDGET